MLRASKGPDAENPEWTPQKFARAKRVDQMPAEVRAALRSGKGRGPQKAPTKTLISLRLSPDVLAALKATGPGWQGRAEEALRRHFMKAAAATIPSEVQ